MLLGCKGLIQVTVSGWKSVRIYIPYLSFTISKENLKIIHLKGEQKIYLLYKQKSWVLSVNFFPNVAVEVHKSVYFRRKKSDLGE